MCQKTNKMPAQSKAQRRLFALALQYKRGKIEKSEVSDDVIDLSKLPEETLKDYAETPENDLPDHVDETTGIVGGGFPYGHEYADPKRREDMQLHFLKKDKIEAETQEKKKEKSQTPVSTFDEWQQRAKVLQEMEGVAATGLNTPGMGNAVPASHDSVGSGDTFGSSTMNHKDWKRWNKMRKKTQETKKKKDQIETQRPAWELGGRLPVPVVNVEK
jgi:hypothetical protein